MFFEDAPDAFSAELTVEGKEGALQHDDGDEIAHALGLVRIIDSDFGFDETAERIAFRDHPHIVIGADRRAPKASDQLGIALDERLTRHRDTIGAAMRF